MRQQFLNHKIIAFIFLALLFIYGIQVVGYAELEFTEGETTTREIAENRAACTDVGAPVRYSAEPFDSCIDIWLRGPDARSFAIAIVSRHGVQLRTESRLNYEKKNLYEVTLTVSDTESPDTDTITVIINVTDVNEAPVFSEQMDEAAVNRVHRSIPENTPIGINIGPPVSATDPDGSEVVLTYSLRGYDAELHANSELFRGHPPVPSDLTGLEHVTNLTHLNLNGNRIADLTPIAGLTNLIALRLYSNQFSSLTPLEGLTNLKSLDLSYNGINDITPLKGLTNLVELFIQLNKIQDITPLKGITNLKTLYLSENNVEDITALEGLTNLTQLFIHVNSIQDITPLRGMTNLETLYLSSNDIEDITALESLTNLKFLHLNYNPHLTDVSPLAGLVNLEILQLNGSPIEDITPLADLTANISYDVPRGSAPAANGNRIDSLLDPAVLNTLDRDALQTRLQRLYVENDGALKDRQAIAMLESVLASMRPDKTVLLANYPNPFNPETWIPYHLGKSADVRVTIYDAYGIVVRHLELGHQSSGYYISRSQAAYWDGCNDFGEHVASGIYFYQLQADTISPIRKMVILK